MRVPSELWSRSARPGQVDAGLRNSSFTCVSAAARPPSTGRDLRRQLRLALQHGDLRALRGDVEGLDVALAGEHALDGSARDGTRAEVAVAAVLEQEEDASAPSGEKRG